MRQLRPGGLLLCVNAQNGAGPQAVRAPRPGALVPLRCRPLTPGAEMPPADDRPPESAAAEPDRVIARLRPAILPRSLGIAFVLGIALILAWAAFAGAASGLAPALTIPGALIALWFAERLWRATRVGIELTPEALRDSEGRVLTPVGAILSVDRGAFAFKPSGGFVLTLSTSPGPAWQPGLWWRYGKRLGVGGVIARAEARAMADAIAQLVAARGR